MMIVEEDRLSGRLLKVEHLIEFSQGVPLTLADTEGSLRATNEETEQTQLNRCLLQLTEEESQSISMLSNGKRNAMLYG